MKHYGKYKPTGVEWIGEIPNHWSVKKLKYVLDEKLKYGANESALFEETKDPRYIRITDFGNDGKLRNDTFKSLPFETAKDYFLKEGDVLFARSGATVGKTFQFKNYTGDACFAGYLIKASPNENQMLSDFLYYFTKSNGYENWKESIFNKATIQNIGADKYSLLEIPLPSIEEQSIISIFLNEKSLQIDKLISNKQKLIELLNEERTAVIIEAVSGKGKNWEEKKLRYLCKITTGAKNTEDRIEDGAYPFYVRSQTVERINSFSFDGEGILTAGDGVGVAKVFHYVNGKIDFHQRVYLFYDFSNEISAKYLFHFIQMNLIYEVLKHNAKSTVDSLRLPMLKDFPITFPTSKVEQNSIVEHIKTESERIDNMISKMETEIELMNEYRTALISEVVTGKIKVA